MKDYTVPGNTWTWNTAGMAAGTYRIEVDVRNAGSTAALEAWNQSDFVLSPPAAAVTLGGAPASPQSIGANVVFTASGSGGSGTYEYKFWLRNGGTWTVVKDYTVPGNTWTWNTAGMAAGTYRIEVDVRSAGSTAALESWNQT